MITYGDAWDESTLGPVLEDDCTPSTSGHWFQVEGESGICAISERETRTKQVIGQGTSSNNPEDAGLNVIACCSATSTPSTKQVCETTEEPDTLVTGQNEGLSFNKPSVDTLVEDLEEFKSVLVTLATALQEGEKDCGSLEEQFQFSRLLQGAESLPGTSSADGSSEIALADDLKQNQFVIFDSMAEDMKYIKKGLQKLTDVIDTLPSENE